MQLQDADRSGDRSLKVTLRTHLVLLFKQLLTMCLSRKHKPKVVQQSSESTLQSLAHACLTEGCSTV